MLLADVRGSLIQREEKTRRPADWSTWATVLAHILYMKQYDISALLVHSRLGLIQLCETQSYLYRSPGSNKLFQE
jgi:hypothetical protein